MRTIMNRVFWVALVVGASNVGCEEKKNEGSTPPPTVAPPVASPASGSVATEAGAHAGPCETGGGEVKDSVSSAFFPRKVGGFCLDPQGGEKTYGEGGKYSMDEVCTTAFDGECEVYKRFGLKRVVSLHYVDGTGAPASVEIHLSKFVDTPGAYGMFTKRVVADSDPMKLSVKPLGAGGEGALGKSNAYVWKGDYLVELTYNTEDPKATKEIITRANEVATAAIAREIGAKLPASPDLPGLKVLPREQLLPLGVQMMPKDALGVTNLGPTVIGAYKDGEKRYRIVTIAADKPDVAKEAAKKLRAKPGIAPIKDVGDEAFAYAHEGLNKTKLDFVFARKEGVLYGVGDEEFAATDDAKLSKDEKIAKLKALVSGAPVKKTK